MAEECERRLRITINNIAKELGYDNHEISVQEFHTGGANYTSRLYHIRLSAPKYEDLKLFAKVAATAEEVRKIYPLQIFDTEIFMYSNMLKRYREIEEEHKIEEQYKLTTSKFYGFSKEYLYETLVMEDMAAKGFKTHDRFKSIDWEYATQAVFEMAKFHALSMALRHHNPEEFDELMRSNGLIFEMHHFKLFFDVVHKSAISVVKEKYRQRLMDFINKQDFQLFNRPIRYPVLTHGDYRPSNLMYKVYENGKLDIVPLDYQGCQSSNPLRDLMYFIFSGSDAAFRARYYRQLLEFYYSELCKALRRLHVDPEEVYSKEDYEYELELMQPYGLIMGVMLIPVITVHEENAPDMTASKFEDFAVKPNEVGAQRLNEVVEDFIKMGIL
ncbi:PREDICTED: uncharacterized protein LOC106102271 [Papilio polytes]|uniref:uncharacterized protein LOC106102271 n=1 Tax=Papilio polytes TaxID=76194 RepID=UPI0006761654|nr:PREDICTED: uncharacterized protein LOC106102271 [Papilio polytes]